MSELDLGPLEAVVRPSLDATYAAREKGLATSRKLIRTSANAIRALHRNEDAKADELMGEAAGILADLNDAVGGEKGLAGAGFVSDATKEYAEARLTAALFRSEALPLPVDLGVAPAPYLHGLGEAVGEQRRRLLDSLRDGDIPTAERMLAAMNEILDLLASLDYPDGMTGGLRRTTDVARSLIERSRADLTTTVVQERLRAELSKRMPEYNDPAPGV